MKENKGLNIRDIAKLAGVSVASVSRALQNKPGNGVSEELRNRILDICEKVRYYPNVHTVRMFSSRANTVAFFFPPSMKSNDYSSIGIMDPNMGAAIAGAEYELSNSSIYMTLASTTKDFIDNKEYLKFIRGKMVDGIIVWGWTEESSYIKALLDEKIPVVMIQCGGDFDINQVVAQDYEGMVSLVEYVASLGHRKIGIANPPATGSAAIERQRGLMDGLKKVGLKPSFVSTEEDFGIEFGFRAGQEILKKAPEVSCIMASNDYAALGVIKAAKEQGLQVPRDLSVTGAGGSGISEVMPLTTYLSPSYQIGIEGAILLKKLINSPDMTPAKLRLSVKLIKGETTKELC